MKYLIILSCAFFCPVWAMDAQDAQKDTLSNSSESFALQLEEITEEDELCELIDKIMEASPNTLTEENIKPFDLPTSPPETNKLESFKNNSPSQGKKSDAIEESSDALSSSPFTRESKPFFSEKDDPSQIPQSLPSNFEKLDIEEPPPPPKNIFYQTGEFLWNSLSYTWTLSTGWIPQLSFLKKKEA